MAPYAKKVVDLSAILNKDEVIPPGVDIPDVTILRLPDAAKDGVFLHVGQGGDPIDLIQGMSIRITPPESGGLYVSSDAAFAGQKLSLLIGYVSGSPQPMNE
ncbi:MAG TPA: hypothetical protein VKA60_27650 [Blastocatellia bacterium]|nr:hypothetical protein [Blastocatellia bacterium]